MLFTTGAPVVSTDTADCVAMGTMSPTWSRALWLSSTTSCGEEMTLTLVTLCKALSVMTAGLLVNVYAKPGKTAPIAPFATLLRTSLLSCCFKKNCVPYCSASLSVTSATVASTSTCSGSTSILRSAASIRLYSDGVAKISRALLRRSGMMRIPFVDAADCESAPGPLGGREDSGAASAAPCGAGLAELPSGAPPSPPADPRGVPADWPVKPALGVASAVGAPPGARLPTRPWSPGVASAGADCGANPPCKTAPSSTADPFWT